MKVAVHLSRRAFIRTVGGSAALAAASPILAACDRMPEEAVAAWRGPDPAETDPRRIALSYAILAPNPHNMQPWLVDLREPDHVTLRVDRDRLLPETDPFGRQILIGHGAFLGLLELAAGALGYRAETAYFPAGAFAADEIDARPVARIRFAPSSDGPVDPLFGQILRRRSNKEPYEDRPLSDGDIKALLGSRDLRRLALAITPDTGRVATLRGLATQAMQVEVDTPRTLRESIERTRIGAGEIAQHRDGIDLHGTFFWWARQLGLLTPDKMATPGTFAWRGGVDYAMGGIGSAAAFGWISSPDNSRATQLDVGRAYVRLNLKATELGVAMHPLSQALQEYAEMTEARRALLAATSTPAGHTVQMFFRLGYAPAPDPAPRRDLDDLVLS